MDRVFEHGGASFRWDESNAAENQRKHGVSFEEAATVFDDPLVCTAGREPERGTERRGDRFQFCGAVTHGGTRRVCRRIHPNHLGVACLASRGGLL
jgi:uncharacterized DUF497 family protein